MRWHLNVNCSEEIHFTKLKIAVVLKVRNVFVVEKKSAFNVSYSPNDDFQCFNGFYFFLCVKLILTRFS